MDVFVTREGQRFAWDSEKDALNSEKHGIFFDRALLVFEDPYYILSDASVDGEERYAALGYDGEETLLLVVYVEILNDIIRIIPLGRRT